MARAATAAFRLLSGEREPVRLATTGNIALSGLQVVDGVLTETGDRILVKDQTDATENGIYGASAGSWYRTSDARSSRTLAKGVTVHVQQGTVAAGHVYSFQTFEPNVGTDDIDIEFYTSETAAGDAADAATAAALSATAAATSATSAATSETAAELAETNAETAETNAETAATAASGSATSAATSAINAANSATAADASADAALVSETNAAASAVSVSHQIVATRTALKALNTAVSTVVVLKEAGREGHFIWTLGNFTARIAQDTQEGVFLKADAVSAATGAWVRVTAGKVFAEWFGAKGDAGTVNTVAIQAGLDFVGAYVDAAPPTAPAYLDFGPGVFVTGPLTLPDRVVMRGAGVAATELYLANGSNTHFIQSVDFATLTGTNAWAVGVPSYLGFDSIRINGNKLNQTAGDGLRLYAKFLIFAGNVMVLNAYGNGIFSEAGEGAGVSSWPTFPEGETNNLMISGCGSHGWHMRGPHDHSAKKLVCLINGGDGIRIQSSAGLYLATADFAFIHSYANTGRGMYVIGSSVRASLSRLEDNYQEGLYLSNADHCQIGELHLFDNCRTSGSFQLDMEATSEWNVMPNILCRTQGRAASGGIRVLGNNNILKGAVKGDVAGGGNSTSVGVEINACGFNNVDVTISDFSGVGGIGLRTQSTVQLYWCRVKAILQNCATLWANTVVGTNNKFEITGTCSAVQTPFSGVGPNVETSRETFDVELWKTGTGQYSAKGKWTGSFNLNSIVEQTITINHLLLAAPLAEDITFGVSSTTTTVTDWAIDFIRVRSVSATQIVVNVKLRVASASAVTALLTVQATL